MQSTIEVDLGGVVLPKFLKTRSPDKITACIFQAECRYDAILGHDVFNQLGVPLNFKDKLMLGDKAEVAMHWYMPGKLDDATISSKDSTIEITSLEEQMMSDLFHDVYED